MSHLVRPLWSKLKSKKKPKVCAQGLMQLQLYLLLDKRKEKRGKDNLTLFQPDLIPAKVKGLTIVNISTNSYEI